jgi:hypothetical protein
MLELHEEGKSGKFFMTSAVALEEVKIIFTIISYPNTEIIIPPRAPLL